MLNNKLYKCTCYVAAYNADGGFCDGCGVVCDGYIITAGHVAENAVSFEVFFGKRLYNLKSNHIVFLDVSYKTEKEQGHDVAVIKLDVNCCGLTISDTIPSTGMEFDSISFKHFVESDTSSILRTSKESYDCIVNYGIVSCVEGNFFGCEMQNALEKGRSGSPCFVGDKLLGILHGGVGEQSKSCFYESAHSIVSLMKSKGLPL